MLKRIIGGVAAAALWCASLGAGAITISVNPAVQSVTVGDAVTVDVVISDLGDFAADSVGAFDIDLLFNDTLLGNPVVTFGTELDVGIFGSIQSSSGFVGGINALEVSLEDPADLNAFQPGSFTLFSVEFDALAAGISTLTPSVFDLSDVSGAALSVDQVDTGSVTINRAVSASEPGTLALLGLGLLSVVAVRRRLHG